MEDTKIRDYIYGLEKEYRKVCPGWKEPKTKK